MAYAIKNLTVHNVQCQYFNFMLECTKVYIWEINVFSTAVLVIGKYVPFLQSKGNKISNKNHAYLSS